MSHKTRWGILGTASIARRRFLPAAHKSAKAEVIAIGSRSLEQAQVFAKEFSITKPYGSYQDVLNDPEVEAVYIPLPNDMHAEWTLRAADAGKHILCEKPMAVDETQALAMADYCRDNGVILMEGFMYRLNPRTLAIQKAIEDGLLGELKALVIQFGFAIKDPQDVRLIPGKGAGSLMDVGCYCINVSRYLMGEEPLWALASQHSHPIIGCDMSTSAILEFDGGRTSLFNCSFETAFRSSLDAIGAEAVLKADRFFAPPSEGKIGFSLISSDGSVEEFEFDAVDQFLLEIDHFSECIKGGEAPLIDPYRDSVGNARVIDSLRRSAESHCRARVAPAL